MCGIAGIVDRAGRIPLLGPTGAVMASCLAHRGPDGEGAWGDETSRVALGHRRLAIIDPTSSGAQPMMSACGRWVITFNGEIYNHVELRRRLSVAGVRFRGASDTEVLVESVAHWGLPGALSRLNGMFAFGAWDAKERMLFLARDRLGEKPLLYGTIGGAFCFASEARAFAVLPGWPPRYDPVAVWRYLELGYVPAPLTMWMGVHKLPAGTWLRVDADGRASEPVAYWSLADAAARGLEQPLGEGDGDAKDAVRELLADSVRLRLRADVPVGAFLSGGIDSSLVTALALVAGAQPRTFTVAVVGETDESSRAEAIARHLGTEHLTVPLTAEDALGAVEGLPAVCDEPFADSSLLPTLLVARATSRHTKVALTGDGGDELFGGYDRYRLPLGLWGNTGGRRSVRALLGTVTGLRGGAALARALPPFAGARRDERLRKLRTALREDEPIAAYRAFSALWPTPPLVRGFAPPAARQDPGFGERATLLLLDQMGYLPDDLLVKVDRATMSVGLEARPPLLDHRLVELSWRIPLRARMGRKGKVILRGLLDEHLPAHLTTGPKRGFGVPMGAWLRGPLREWAEDMLAPAALARTGMLDPAPIRNAWQAHLSGRVDWQQPLWAVLVLQSWLGARETQSCE